MTEEGKVLCANCQAFYAVPAHWPCCKPSCLRKYKTKRRNGLA